MFATAQEVLEMRTIHKYPLQTCDEQVIEMPVGAEILCVQVQNGVACLWASVETTFGLSGVRIYTFGTGHPLPAAELRYVGTYQLDGGSLVFHVYEDA